jgi:hypothetical protein
LFHGYSFFFDWSKWWHNLKLQRADLERKHTEKLVELREEKKQLEDGIAKINELILNARKDSDDKWERHKALMLN